MFSSKQTNMTAQNIKTVCHAFATKSGFHKVMAERISCPPLKFIESVTVQLPISVSQPVIQLVMGAHSRVASIADQYLYSPHVSPC